MSRLRPTLSPDVRALLDRERAIPPVSAAERAHALTRARAALVAGMPKTDFSGAARWPRWLAHVAAACVASAAIGASAYEIRAHLASATVGGPAAPVGATAPPAPSVPSAPSPPPGIPAPPAASEVSPVVTGLVGGPTQPSDDTSRSELRLLRQARAAVARDDFAAALPPIVEHARRFKNGRLAEEREALRVKALTGLGRTADARRAAAAFEARFPRSVLLRSVTQMPASGQ